MRLFIRALAAALLAVLALPGMAHADDDSRFDARALVTASESLLAEPALGSPEVGELVAGEVYQARSEVTPGANGWGFHEVAAGEVTGYVLEGVVIIIPAEDPAPEDLTKRAHVTSGGPLHAYPHPDSAPVAEISTGDTVYVDPDAGVEVTSFLSTDVLVPVETADGAIGWVSERAVQVVGERGDEDDVPEPAEEPAEDETSEPTTEDPAADEATDEPGDDSPAPADEEGAATGDPAEEPFTVLGRGITDPLLLGGAAGALLLVALGWAALRRRGGGRDVSVAAPVTGAVPVAPAPEPPEPEIEELEYDDGDGIEELVYDGGDDDVEELVYDDAVPTTAHDADKDRFEF